MPDTQQKVTEKPALNKSVPPEPISAPITDNRPLRGELDQTGVSPREESEYWLELGNLYQP